MDTFDTDEAALDAMAVRVGLLPQKEWLEKRRTHPAFAGFQEDRCTGKTIRVALRGLLLIERGLPVAISTPDLWISEIHTHQLRDLAARAGLEPGMVLPPVRWGDDTPATIRSTIILKDDHRA